MNWTQEEYDAAVSGFSQQRARAEATTPVQPKAPRPRQNKWEQEYENLLRGKWGKGVIQWYGFEAIKLRLAGNTFYTPDFAVLRAGNLELHEVKGFWRDDALVKFKVAAEKFPFLFLAWRKLKRGGGWELIRSIQGGH